jgi:hypothetical protein
MTWWIIGGTGAVIVLMAAYALYCIGFGWQRHP